MFCLRCKTGHSHGHAEASDVVCDQHGCDGGHDKGHANDHHEHKHQHAVSV